MKQSSLLSCRKSLYYGKSNILSRPPNKPGHTIYPHRCSSIAHFWLHHRRANLTKVFHFHLYDEYAAHILLLTHTHSRTYYAYALTAKCGFTRMVWCGWVVFDADQCYSTAELASPYTVSAHIPKDTHSWSQHIYFVMHFIEHWTSRWLICSLRIVVWASMVKACRGISRHADTLWFAYSKRWAPTIHILFKNSLSTIRLGIDLELGHTHIKRIYNKWTKCFPPLSLALWLYA